MHNHLLGGGFGRRLEVDGVVRAVQIAQQVDGPVKVIWTREEDIQHDMYRPYCFDRLSAGLDARACRWPGTIASRARRSSRAGCRSASTRASIPTASRARPSSPTACPNKHVEYLRVEPPGIPTGVLARRRALAQRVRGRELHRRAGGRGRSRIRSPTAARCSTRRRAPRRCWTLAAEKAGWGQAAADGQGRGISVQVGVRQLPGAGRRSRGRQGRRGARPARRVPRSTAASWSIPTRCARRSRARVIFGITAALYGEITIKDGRVEQIEFRRLPHAADRTRRRAIEVHIVQSARSTRRHGRAGDVRDRAGSHQRDLRRDRQAPAQAAGRTQPCCDGRHDLGEREKISLSRLGSVPDAGSAGH